MTERSFNLLWQSLEPLSGMSHGREHSETVLKHACVLQRLYGGDKGVIGAAAILHDLGRTRPELHGQESLQLSTELARPVLQEAGFDAEMIERVIEVILDHDQPEHSPETVEGRIVKDADFLAGMGAVGILRSILYTGEAGQNQNKAVYRLSVQMLERIGGLEFAESKRHAWREYQLVKYFLECLECPGSLERESHAGKSLIIEGVSGSGKNTQAEKLSALFKTGGIDVLTVKEPNEERRNELRRIRGKGRWTNILTYSLDRALTTEESVGPALESGGIVIQVRSFLSTMVYQATTALERAEIGLLHSMFMPEPSCVILLDVDPLIAMNRIIARGEKRGRHETLEQLTEHTERYRVIVKSHPQGLIIDGNKSPEEVHQEISKKLDAFLAPLNSLASSTSSVEGIMDIS